MSTASTWMYATYQNLFQHLDMLLSQAIGPSYSSADGFEVWKNTTQPQGSGKFLSWHELTLFILQQACENLRLSYNTSQGPHNPLPGLLQLTWDWVGPDEPASEERLLLNQRRHIGVLGVKYTPDPDQEGYPIFYLTLRYHAFQPLEPAEELIVSERSLYDHLFHMAYTALDERHFRRFKSHLHAGRFGVEAFDGIYEALRWEYLYNIQNPSAPPSEEIELTEDRWVILPAGIPKWLQICQQEQVNAFRLYLPLQNAVSGYIGRLEFKPLKTALVGPAPHERGYFAGVHPLSKNAIEPTHLPENYLAFDVSPLAFCQIIYAALQLEQKLGSHQETTWHPMHNWESDREEEEGGTRLSSWYALGGIYSSDRLRDALYLRLCLEASDKKPDAEETPEETTSKRKRSGSRDK